jgi:hypothetical protein
MYIRPLSGNTEMLLMSHYMYGLSNSVRVGAFQVPIMSFGAVWMPVYGCAPNTIQNSSH